MIIVKEDAIAKLGECYQYNGVPFSGIALTIYNGEIVRKLEYLDGYLQGEYVNTYFSDDNNQLHIESSSLDDEFEEPGMYKGKHFSGITYSFDGNKCFSEKEYEHGWVISEFVYGSIGELEYFEISTDDLVQTCKWYDEKVIELFEIFEKNNFRIRLCFSETGKVKNLWIDGNYFERIHSLNDKLKYNLFSEKDFVKQLIGDNYLYITGSAIDNNIFEHLLMNNGLSNTSILRISRTLLDLTSLKKLVLIKNIKKLYIESEVLSIEDLQNFKYQRSDCFVEFNKKEVVILNLKSKQ